jgi:hypothetical protein
MRTVVVIFDECVQFSFGACVIAVGVITIVAVVVVFVVVVWRQGRGCE